MNNEKFIPPYGTYGSLYLRPLFFGSGPTVGVNPSSEYTFIVFCVPAGPYYKNNDRKRVQALINTDFDRSAPKGCDCHKIAGNYAQSLTPDHTAREKGYAISLFLDSKTNQYIDEFSTSNFVGISKTGTYVTPDSKTVLPSITNMSLMQLTGDMGYKVEKRPIHINELREFEEVAACGTAVTLVQIDKILYADKAYEYADKPDSLCGRLHDKLKAIQYGEEADCHNWLREINISATV